MLTTHLLTKNNQSTIRRAVNSLRPLKCQILIGDMGSTDQTISICQELDCDIFDINPTTDRSIARNTLVIKSKHEWQFYIEPWEAIINGHDTILNPTFDMLYATILQEEIVTKQIRLFNKKCGAKFVRPIYESVEPEINGQLSDITIGSDTVNSLESLPILSQWKINEPTNPEPDYYMACVYLSNCKYDQFLKFADHYIFKEEKPTMSAVMTRYYYAQVLCHIKKNPDSAIKHLLKCLMIRPLMAEFWCALGDVYFFNLRQAQHAIIFYENAIILGKQRAKDKWPLEIKKYQEYPRKMIDNISKLVNMA